MKSIPQIAEGLDISSTTIREYISRFNEFFADPVEYEGVKEYPDETFDLVQKIHQYYQTTGMTKQEIKVKLGGAEAMEPVSHTSVAVAAPVDPEQFAILGEKLDYLAQVIENLTQAITNAGNETFFRVKKNIHSHEKLNQINEQITDIIELSRGNEGRDIEKNVLDADGTIIFSFGKLSANAADSMNFAKAHKKPWLHVDLEKEKNPAPILRTWLAQFEIKVLNVAGRSASKVPGLKRSVNDIISMILKK